MPPLTSMLLALQDALPDGAIERGSDAIEETWRFLEMPAMWIVALLIVPGSLAIAAIAYSRESLSRPMRWTLVGLRTLSFLLLFAVLFRPVFVRQEQSVIAPEVLFLFDGSGSMAREDGYVGDDEARDAVRALTGESADSVSRIELAEAVRPRLLSAAREAGYVPRALRFADDVTPLADGARLDARGASTAIGDAIRGALAGARGRYVTDIVLVSDGRSNVGTPPDEVAAAARAAGVAIDTVLVGDDRTEVNVAVELVDAPEAVLEGDQIAVAARVSARGTEGSASSCSRRSPPATPRTCAWWRARRCPSSSPAIASCSSRAVTRWTSARASAASACASLPWRESASPTTTRSRSRCASTVRRSACSTWRATRATSTASSTGS